MPLIKHADLKPDESNPDLKRLTLIDASAGAGYLTVGELIIAPGKKIPMHIHQTHEEGIYIMEGPLNYVLGDETGVVNAGDVVLAPAMIKHELSNAGTDPKRIMFIFPTTNVQREFVD